MDRLLTCHDGVVDRSTIPEPLRKAWHNDEPIRLGVSSCLLGAEVRYDGGHKQDRYLTDVLGRWFDWVPVCPEVELGLGTPRSPIQLVKDRTAPRLVEPVSDEDLTARMERFARKRLAELEGLGLDGFIFKSRSPSCGIKRVKVFSEDGMPSKKGVGVFARVVIRRWPDLPVAEEEELWEPGLCKEFIERVLSRYRNRVASDHDLDAEQSADLDAAHRALLERLTVKSQE